MYNITIDHIGSILRCSIEGENRTETVVRYLNDVHHAMEAHRCGKVLIIENLSGPGLNLFQMYHIIRSAKKTVLALPHMIAYIDLNPQHHHASLKFAETVALNRFIHMRLFTDEQTAIEWLERTPL